MSEYESHEERCWVVVSVPDHVNIDSVKRLMDNGFPEEVTPNQVDDDVIVVGIGEGHQMNWLAREDMAGMVNNLHQDITIVVTPTLDNLSGAER